VAGGQDYRLATSTQSKQQQQQQHDQGGSTARGVGRWLVGPDSNKQLQQQWQQLAQDMATLASSAAGSATHGGVAHTASTAIQAVPDPGGASATIPLPFNRSLWVPKVILQPHMHPATPQQTMQALDDPAAATRAATQQTPAPQQQQQQQQVSDHEASGPDEEVFAGVYFTFDQLCGNSGSRQSLAQAGALSANDYLALVQSCRQLFAEGVPQLQPSQRDEVCWCVEREGRGREGGRERKGEGEEGWGDGGGGDGEGRGRGTPMCAWGAAWMLSVLGGVHLCELIPCS